MGLFAGTWKAEICSNATVLCIFHTQPFYITCFSARTQMVDSLQHVTTSLCQVNAELRCHATFTQERAHCTTQSKLCSNGNSLSSCACWIVPSHAPVEIIIIIIMIFIVDSSISQTQEHKKWLAVHQRTLQKRCLHVTNTGRSKAVYPHHSCIIIRKSTENG